MIILEFSLARLISLLFLSIRGCFMFWLSLTSNEYFLIVCSIKYWKSQCGKMQTRICHFYCVNIQLKYHILHKFKTRAFLKFLLQYSNFVTTFACLILRARNYNSPRTISLWLLQVPEWSSKNKTTTSIILVILAEFVLDG